MQQAERGGLVVEFLSVGVGLFLLGLALPGRALDGLLGLAWWLWTIYGVYLLFSYIF